MYQPSAAVELKLSTVGTSVSIFIVRVSAIVVSVGRSLENVNVLGRLSSTFPVIDFTSNDFQSSPPAIVYLTSFVFSKVLSCGIVNFFPLVKVTVNSDVTCTSLLKFNTIGIIVPALYVPEDVVVLILWSSISSPSILKEIFFTATFPALSVIFTSTAKLVFTPGLAVQVIVAVPFEIERDSSLPFTVHSIKATSLLASVKLLIVRV